MDTPIGRLLKNFEESLATVTDLVHKMEDGEEKIQFIMELQYNLANLRHMVEENAHMTVLSSLSIR